MAPPPPRRSSSGFHILLPASNSRGESVLVPLVPPQYDILCWTFGRRAAFWLVWPAVLLFTLFSLIITSISVKYNVTFAVSTELITVLGIVIGYVISYRLTSGYERYSSGREAWSTLMRTIRSMGRLIWIHIPLRLTFDANHSRESNIQEAKQVMKEKRLALELIEGFAVATKHHLRGEIGIFYEDLYDLVKPLHKHSHYKPILKTPGGRVKDEMKDESDDASKSEDSWEMHTVNPLGYNRDLPPLPEEADLGSLEPSDDPDTMAVNDDCSAADEKERPFLLPSSPRRVSSSKYRADLIPFAPILPYILKAFTLPKKSGGYVLQEDLDSDDLEAETKLRATGPHIGKYRPEASSHASNLPLEILRVLDEWVSRLDARGSLAANPLANIHICITSFETCLTTMEQILTTPLPFVYSAHIKQCVWLYLFILPFQIVDQYQWYTIPAVTVASYFFLGLLAAGSEIEQPFGYDDNDLDVDTFCGWIRNDLSAVRQMRCPNAYFPQDDGTTGSWFPGHTPDPEQHASQLQNQAAATASLRKP